ncbi:MAG: hypothetical protein WKG01_17220 [Kofleriaceae bacterium]
MTNLRAALVAMVCSLTPWASLPAVVSTGCMGCTQRGVLDGLTIDVTAPYGAYRLDTTANGETLSVRFEITLERYFCDTASCHGSGVDTFVSVMGTSRGFEVRVGSTRDPEPSTVELRVFRDQRLVLDTTIEPRYERVYPNGEDCDDGGDVAYASLVVP